MAGGTEPVEDPDDSDLGIAGHGLASAVANYIWNTYLSTKAGANELWFLPNANHYLQHDDPEGFVDVVTRALTGNSPEAPGALSTNPERRYSSTAPDPDCRPRPMWSPAVSVKGRAPTWDPSGSARRCTSCRPRNDNDAKARLAVCTPSPQIASITVYRESHVEIIFDD